MTVQDFSCEIARIGTPVLVEFYASWCGKCAMMEDVVEAFARKNEKITVWKIDIDKEPELAAAQGVSVVPTFFSFADGKMKGMTAGVVREGRLSTLFMEEDLQR